MSKMTERLVVGGVALVAGLLLGWMIRGPATYNVATQTITTYQDWRTACPAANQKDAPCEMIQDILDPKSKGTVARIAITRDGKKQMIGFTLPFGVALEAGIGLRIGKDPVSLSLSHLQPNRLHRGDRVRRQAGGAAQGDARYAVDVRRAGRQAGRGAGLAQGL